MSDNLSKEVRMEALLQAAIEVFLENGYDGASVDMIAKRAGVSKGGFYYHFLNKETILMEANRKLSEPVIRIAEIAIQYESPMGGLKFYIREYLNYWIQHPKELSFFFLSMAKALASPILMDYYKESVKNTSDFFVTMFQRAIELGETDMKDAEPYGISLMGALDGAVSYAMIRSKEEQNQLINSLEKVWIEDLLVR